MLMTIEAMSLMVLCRCTSNGTVLGHLAKVMMKASIGTLKCHLGSSLKHHKHIMHSKTIYLTGNNIK
jgi:hypothetical protein